jgi:hypothetical protein
MAWRKRAEMFPGPLREFREAEWPPVEGECLGMYACRGLGYESACVSLDGPCGWRFYAAPHAEGIAEAQRSREALTRFRQARMSWLAGAVGEDHPLWLDEFCRSLGDV